MKALFTGMNGTVAPYVSKVFEEHGYSIYAYDRNVISTENEDDIKSFFIKHRFDVCLHFAMGSYEWTKLLAKVTKELKIPFIFISTVSVFSNDQIGPYLPSTMPHAKDDYGLYKIQSEQIVSATNEYAYIIRIGWQIGYDDQKNQMLHFIHDKMLDQGFVDASSKWFPSCSFMKDTGFAIYDIFKHQQPSLYHVNSNDSYTFYEICSYLSSIYPGIIVKESKDFIADHRMIDDRVHILKFSSLFSSKNKY